MQSHSSIPSEAPVLAIIGGGVSGAGVAFHLARLLPAGSAHSTIKPRMVVFEPRAELGRGLAYDTLDPAHRINVPAALMSLQPDEPGQFQEWLEKNDALADDPDARRADGRLFPRRRVFGNYVSDMLRPLVDDGTIVHRHAAVTSVEHLHGRWSVTDDKGGVTLADIFVIATSHPPPVAPGRLAAALAGHPRFIADTTKNGVLGVIRPRDRVLVIGNGLTAADVIASLARQGHEGSITAVSRRGLRSRGHASVPQEPFGDFLAQPLLSASALLGMLRKTIRAARAEGRSWHGVIDRLRSQGNEFWRSLPIIERRRIVRHLRPYWDVHRFRIAPQVEAVLDEAIATGRLEILAASVADAWIEGDLIRCRLRPRHARAALERDYDAVVVTTGPAHGGILATQPWLQHLASAGYLSLDSSGLGLACSPSSEAVGADGRLEPTLLIAGPLARGTFGELMGLPEVTAHAVFVAARIAEKLGMVTVK